jgi:hypothetical protein
MSTQKFAGLAACVLVFGSGIFVAFGWGPGSAGDPEQSRQQLAIPPHLPGNAVLAVSATPSPSPAPLTPRPDRCGPPVDRAYLAINQVLAYYGNPYTEQMGILGEMAPTELAARLKSHAATYDALNGAAGIRPAFHIVYGRATVDPGRDGNHLLYVDDATMAEYINLACQEGFLVFIDLQIGLSDVRSEVEKVLPFLDQPHVNLAIDPEFAMPPGELPGDAVGTVDATDVNAAQEMMQAYIQERGLGDRLLIVHKFLPEMVTRPELLQTYPNVGLVMDMDGFGPSEVKTVKFGWFSVEAEYSGIKLFFKQDPDLMSEADVLGLQPDVIIYQ